MGLYGSPMPQESGCSFSRTTGEYMRARATSAADAGAAEARGAAQTRDGHGGERSGQDEGPEAAAPDHWLVLVHAPMAGGYRRAGAPAVTAHRRARLREGGLA